MPGPFGALNASYLSTWALVPNLSVLLDPSVALSPIYPCFGYVLVVPYFPSSVASWPLVGPSSGGVLTGSFFVLSTKASAISYLAALTFLVQIDVSTVKSIVIVLGPSFRFNRTSADLLFLRRMFSLCGLVL